MDENRIENAAPVIGTVDALAAYVELPLLAPVLSEEQIHAGLAVAREFALAAVCVRPCDVDVAVRGLSQSRVKVAAAQRGPAHPIQAQTFSVMSENRWGSRCASHAAQHG